MCICKPDIRSDYTLLQIPVTIEHLNRESLNNESRDSNGNHGDQSYLASEEYSSSSHSSNIDDDCTWKMPKWEKRIRIVMMIILTFISLSVYQKQNQVGVQRERLHKSMQDIEHIRRKIESRRLESTTKKNGQELLDMSEKFASFEIDIDTRIDNLLE
mmetsp:Transcript_9973/g.12578  ORF Transcript_9973/g.12578 Transcript_9973/m.12578 type:complete len:158 (+) Transcript_9973:119-592(+)